MHRIKTETIRTCQNSHSSTRKVSVGMKFAKGKMVAEEVGRWVEVDLEPVRVEVKAVRERREKIFGCSLNFAKPHRLSR